MKTFKKKEKIFFFLILCLYFFLLSILLVNNLSKKKQETSFFCLSDIYTQDNFLIAKNIEGYVYYLYCQTEEEINLAKKYLLIHFPSFKKEIKINTNYLLKKKIFPIKNSLPNFIFCRKENFRYYPYKKLFFHPIGFFNKNIIFGLEKYNYKINQKNKISKIITTLVFPLQYHLYKCLKNGLKTYHGEKIHGVLQNEEGEILALISLPCDNIKYNKTPNLTKNGVFFNLYEFGSIFKIFSFMLGLNEFIIDEKMIFNTNNSIKIGKFEIHDVHHRKQFNLIEAFSYSSNISTIILSKLIYEKIGKEKILDFYENKLLLTKSISQEDISTTKIKKKNFKSYEVIHMSIGYSFSTGMLEILRAFIGIITNKIFNPTLIKNQKYFISSLDLKNKNVLFKGMLLNSEKNTFLKKYKVMGKTGTAKIISNGIYLKNYFNTFYICYFEKDNKKYFLLLCLEKVKNSLAAQNIKLIAENFIKKIMKLNL